MSNRIVVAGGSGALGSLLVDAYGQAGWKVVVLSRLAARPMGNLRRVAWDGQTLGNWVGELEGATAVVNLVGRSINTRFTARNKQEIRDSRVLSTAAIGDAILRSSDPPKVWINAGGISIYRSSAVLRTEDDSPDGTDFLAQVSRAWEAAFAQAVTPKTRKVQLRIGSVLLSKGGMLAPLVKLAKFGLGGPIGNGDQYISWIHEQDFVKLISWLISDRHLTGIVHSSNPNPVQNKDFMLALRKCLGIPIGLPNREWSTKLGGWIIGTEPELVLSGHRVVSKVLGDEGFRFDFPELGAALHNLIV